MGEIDVDKTEIFYPLLSKITFISKVPVAEKGMMGVAMLMKALSEVHGLDFIL